MRGKILLVALLALPIAFAAPQAKAPDGFEHWTAKDLEGFAKNLSQKAAGDPHHPATEKFPGFTRDRAMLAYRLETGQPEWHEIEADIFVVQSGSATLIVGGTLVNPRVSGEHEKTADSIEGGARETLSPGDIVRIPTRVPHQLLLDAGQKFSYFVVKIKTE